MLIELPEPVYDEETLKKFKSGTFYIHSKNRDTGETYRKKVTGVVNDIYGIHKNGNEYVLTHLETGLKICTAPTKKDIHDRIKYWDDRVKERIAKKSIKDEKVQFETAKKYSVNDGSSE